MDVAVIVTDQQTTHEGVVRPFVNLAKAPNSQNHYKFLLLNCSVDFQNTLAQKVEVTPCKNRSELVGEAQKFNPKLVLSDDCLNRMRIAQEIKTKTGGKTAAYVQILFGSHSIAACFDLSHLSLKQKIIYKPLAYLPFSWFRNKYTSLLNRTDIVIANSKITASLLHSLYNVEVAGVIYPPVDTKVFSQNQSSRHDEITVYLGSHLGDTKQEFTQKIVKTAAETGIKVNLFGNPKLAQIVMPHHLANVFYHQNITDTELVALYGASKLIVCPQKWEQFGYVPVESISCGTPVLAFNCMGFQETVTAPNGWLANNEAEFIQTLKNVLASPNQLLKNGGADGFSQQNSEANFMLLLEKYFNI